MCVCVRSHLQINCISMMVQTCMEHAAKQPNNGSGTSSYQSTSLSNIQAFHSVNKDKNNTLAFKFNMELETGCSQ